MRGLRCSIAIPGNTGTGDFDADADADDDDDDDDADDDDDDDDDDCGVLDDWTTTADVSKCKRKGR